MKVSIEVNGYLIKNKNSLKFNEPGKQVSIWTWSSRNYKDGVASGGLLETLDRLKENGFEPKVVYIEDSKKQDNHDNIEEEYEEPEFLFKEINRKCLGCLKECKQTARAEIYRCPKYTSIPS